MGVIAYGHARPDGSYFPLMDGPLVIAYDGTFGSRRAVEEAARLFPHASAVVVYVHEPAGRALVVRLSRS